MKTLLDKLEQLKYEYLEKDREVQVLRKNLEETRESQGKIIGVKTEELRHTQETLELVRREADTLRDMVDSQRRTSSSAGALGDVE